MLIYSVGLKYDLGDGTEVYTATGTVRLDSTVEALATLPSRVQAKALAAHELRERMSGARVLVVDILGERETSTDAKLDI